MTQLTQLQPSTTDDTHAPAGKLCPTCGAPHDGCDRFCTVCGSELFPAVGQGGERPVTGELKTDIDGHKDGSLHGREERPSKHKYFRCKNCGAEVATDPDHRSYTCPFCDSTYVVEYAPETTVRQRPEFVIGFEITPEQALATFRQWLATNAWFRPGDLVMAKIEEKLRGVYLPFWAFPMLAESRWSVQIGEHWYRTETYTTRVNKKTVRRTRRVRETEWWPLEGRHHRFYREYLVSGSRGLPQGEAERIKPFYLPALKRYQPLYLAGWMAEEYSIDRKTALQLCQQEFYRREQANVGAFMPGDTHRKLAVETSFTHVSSDLLLLPIYILSYRYGEKVYRFLLNGQTGKAAGDKPVSKRRITATVLGLLGILVLLWGLYVLLAS